MPTEKFKICPFLEDPGEECYVVNPTSREIERLIIYCGGKYNEYEKCGVYLRLLEIERQRYRKAAGVLMGDPPALGKQAPDKPQEKKG